MKKWFYPASLIIIFIILTSVIIPAGCVYGSNTDWLSQHVTLAESIRTACLEQNTLLPSWIGLGGGANGFQFAYYGFLRPDIILGCLFPMVPMLNIIICYMLLLYITSVLLCYVWLRTEHLNPAPAWFGSMLFMTAGCMFHMHRQIMFVNYLPFLLLAFLCIAKKKYKAVSICMLLICLHSFYFAISAFAAIGWYWYRNEGADFWRKSFFRKYIPSSALAAGMAGVLLLPTGLALLEHRSGGSSFSWQKFLELFGPNLSMNNLLFNEYGILSFSSAPATMAGSAGILLIIAAVLAGICAVLFCDGLTGIPLLVCLILLLNGIQMVFISIIGQYVSKDYMESKRRPIYIVKKKGGF